ncbi:MAG: recombinase zinc beta ribbon domain-containing protein, partial [Pseudomonadota bacterium]|nr:recombinase zinc beta ribbon domain-containing protein [Pseudomonadota bacterium]
MLGNPAYVGRAEFGKREAVARGAYIRPGKGRPAVPSTEKSSTRPRPADQRIVIPVPPIVAEDLFAAAQEQLHRNQQLAARRVGARRYLLQGLVRCGRCGYAVAGSTCTRNDTRYYRCRSSSAGTRCGVPGVRGDQLDAHVWNAVRALLEDPARLVEEWMRRASADGAVAVLREQEIAAKKLIQSLDTQNQRLADAYEVGVLELEDFQRRSARVKERRRLAEGELAATAAAMRRNVELSAIVATFEGFRGLMSVGFDEATWEQRQQILRAVVSYVTVDETSATISYRIPASEPGPPPVGTATEPTPDSTSGQSGPVTPASEGGIGGGTPGRGKFALCSGRHP